MSLIRLAYVLAVRRTISNLQLEMVLFIGIVMAVALMSSGVIFSDMLAEAALAHTVSRSEPEETNIRIRSFIGSEAPATASGRAGAYLDRLEFVEQRVASPLRPYLREQAHIIESSTFFYQGHPQLELADEIRPRGAIQYMQGLWPERAELQQGRWPYSDAGEGRTLAGGELEVAVDTLGAELLQLNAGDQMVIFPASFFTDPPVMRAKIVGVFQKTDPDHEFWSGTNRDFSFQDDRWTMVPLFTTADALLNQVVTLYPPALLDVTWIFHVDRQGIRTGDVDTLQRLTRAVQQDVGANLTNSTINTELYRVLDEYEDRILPTRIPLFLILFLVTAILIYYLGLVSGLMVKSRSTELAMFKSRGATSQQLGLMALVESLLLAIPAVFLGPLLAQGVVQLLGRVFFGLGGGGELADVPVSLTTQAFLLGLAGGVLAVVALTGFTLLAARQSIVEFRQSGARPPRAPFIHRYYLDILFLAIIGILWWQTQSRDTFLVRSLESGNLEIDYSLLLGPVLGLLAIGLLVLRFFPIFLALATRLAQPVGSSWLVHGLRHVSRDPIMPGVLVVMLMLATALGVIGSTFSATLQHSQRDRALYATGADLHIQHNSGLTSQPLLGLADQVDDVDGIEGAAEVRRLDGSLLTRGFNATNFSILGVDSLNFSRVGWYRKDFSNGKSLEDLTDLLRPEGTAETDSVAGVDLPKDTTGLSLWAQPNKPDHGLEIRARLKDSEGRFFDIHMGNLGFRGWRRIDAELVPLPFSGRPQGRDRAPVVTPPYSLQFLEVFRFFGRPEPAALFLGRLSARTPSGQVTITDFQDLDQWHVLEDYSRPSVSYYTIEASELTAPESTGRSAVFSWVPGGIGLRGIRPGQPEEPLPAVVNQSLLDRAGAGLGDTLNVSLSNYALALKVVAVADYFPTLDPEERPFAVVDLKTFNEISNLHSPRLVGGSDELWAGLGGPNNGVDAIARVLSDQGLRLNKPRLASEIVAERLDQPLVNAGWGGLLVLVFLVLVLASASGVMLFSYIDTRQRQTEFALLRTLGSSTRQLNRVVWFNVLLVVASGVGLGSWVGYQVGASLLPLIEVAEDGARVVPPMVLHTNWTTLLVTYLTLAGVTIATVAWLSWYSGKIEVQRALRIGEV